MDSKNRPFSKDEWSEEAIIARLGGEQKARTAMALAVAMVEAGILDHITLDNTVNNAVGKGSQNE